MVAQPRVLQRGNAASPFGEHGLAGTSHDSRLVAKLAEFTAMSGVDGERLGVVAHVGWCYRRNIVEGPRDGVICTHAGVEDAGHCSFAGPEPQDRQAITGEPGIAADQAESEQTREAAESHGGTLMSQDF
jgi:hypothetical protein